MNEAIKLAIEKGGYKVDEITTPLKKCEQDPVIKERVNIEGSNGYWDWFCYNDFIVDPLFWQALGKAIGWRQRDKAWLAYNQYNCEGKEWLFYAHLYFDLVFTGGDTEKFWQELTSEKNMVQSVGD
jgi:hypothetical protein